MAYRIFSSNIYKIYTNNHYLQEKLILKYINHKCNNNNKLRLHKKSSQPPYTEQCCQLIWYTTIQTYRQPPFQTTQIHTIIQPHMLQYSLPILS